MTRSQFVLAWRKRRESETHCFYCGRPFGNVLRSPHQDHLHGISRKSVEHLVSQHSYKCGPTLINNIVNACSGCNNGKNGYSIIDFRGWFGKPFYAEIILGEQYPVYDNSVKGDGTMRIYFGGLFQAHDNAVAKIIEERFEGRGLRARLRKIVHDAQHDFPAKVKIHV